MDTNEFHPDVPNGIVPGRFYELPNGTCWQWLQERGEWQQAPPGIVDDNLLSWEQARAADIPSRHYPPPPPPSGQELLSRYANVIAPVVQLDDLFIRLQEAEAEAEAEAARKRWRIDHVLAQDSNLVILGDDKATKSTEMHELVVTFTTASDHWGLTPFGYDGEPGSVLLVQEENDRQTVEQDLADIAVARGLPPDEGKALRRIISKPGLNLLNPMVRAWLCHAAKDYDFLLLDSLDKMGVPETNATGELADMLRFLTQLQTQLQTFVIFSWPFASRMRFDFDSALGGDHVPRWWQGGMALSFNAKTAQRHVKVCANRHRLGRHELRLQGHGMGRWELKASADEGEKLPAQASLDADKAKRKAHEMREAGQSVKQIAKALDVSERSVYRYFKKEEA